MHLFDESQSQPITDTSQLVSYFKKGAKPAERWLVGTEHEMAGVLSGPEHCGDALSYEGPRGIHAIYQAYVAQGWTPIYEGQTLIALSKDGSQITYEPGGQFEHAIKPLVNSEVLRGEIMNNFKRLNPVSEGLGIAWLNTAFRPFGKNSDVPWMPKQRYGVMREYLPTRGGLAHEMMKRTCTVQVNLDYSDAEDALLKMRCVQSITSLLTALYANSPIVDGQITDYQSYRANIWLDTDPDRCGLLAFLHEDGDVFAGYAEWALDVPMFFIHREAYIPCGGLTFRQFMKQGFQGQTAVLADWGLHLSTLFPEVRLKQYIEIRACDVGSVEMMVSLHALAASILYNRDACVAATNLTGGLSMADRERLRREVPKQGLLAKAGGKTLQALCLELLTIAESNAQCPDARGCLQPLWQIARDGRSQAEGQKELWRRHQGDTAALISALAYKL